MQSYSKERHAAAVQPEKLAAQARTALRRALAELAGCAQRDVALIGVRRLVAKSGPPGLLVAATAALGADPAAAQQLAAQLHEVRGPAVPPAPGSGKSMRTNMAHKTPSVSMHPVLTPVPCSIAHSAQRRLRVHAAKRACAYTAPFRPSCFLQHSVQHQAACKRIYVPLIHTGLAGLESACGSKLCFQ